LDLFYPANHPHKKNPQIMFFKNKPFILVSAIFTLLSLNVQSTIVEIRTSLGIVEVNLFDSTTPATVANFLSYANSGSYAGTVVHRSVSNFIIQGGGFTYTGPVAVNSFTLDSIPTGTPITNDPKLSNVRGTIAMAKTSNPDSATSQWFINLSNNSNSLDVVSNAGGFTVFGQVVGDGMQVIDAIAALTRFNGGGAFGELPIRDYTQTDVDNDVAITDENLVIISDIVITDSVVDTAANLNPVANTLVNSSNGGGDSGSGGGAIGWLLLLGLVMLQRSCLIKR
jgi:peptidyl-prolyl cis-trans isomerase A (cyclophilin A)